MPEGHSVHRLARSLHRSFAGEPVRVSSPQGRFAAGAAELDGTVLEGADAWGKHLFLAFERDRVVHVHLGLYGTFVREPAPAAEARGAVRLRLESPQWYADLRGPTACDVLSLDGRAAVLERLGPDPLRPDADPELAFARIRGSRAPMGGLLMDQSVIAGLGNIYRAELLFRHRVSPFAEGRAMRPAALAAMWDDISGLMRDGVRRGRIVTVEPGERDALAALDVDRPASDDPDLDGGEDTLALRRLRRSTGTYVYRRDGRPCVRCGSTVRAQDFQGRRLYWCPRCQRAPRVRR